MRKAELKVGTWVRLRPSVVPAPAREIDWGWARVEALPNPGQVLLDRPLNGEPWQELRFLEALQVTPAQHMAMLRLSLRLQDAYTLRTSLSTLRALTKRGLAQCRTQSLGSMFSPRTANAFRASTSQELHRHG